MNLELGTVRQREEKIVKIVSERSGMHPDGVRLRLEQGYAYKIKLDDKGEWVEPTPTT